MKKNIAVSFIILSFIFVMSACNSKSNTQISKTPPLDPADSSPDIRLMDGEFMVINLPGNNGQKVKIQAKVARTKMEQEVGLMYVQHMLKDVGMIFVFDKAEMRSFWMKNTLIPLDMIFLDDQMKVVNIVKSAQPCKTEPCQFYLSTKPARYVLEVNAGVSDSAGVKEGDKFDLQTVKKNY